MSELPNSILPGEIVADILVRLPVKLICRLKCISKPWRSFLSNPQFARDHLKLHMDDPEYLIISSFRADYASYILTLSAGKSATINVNDGVARKVYFLPSKLKGWSLVAGSCHGLVLLELKDAVQCAQCRRVLFNPITLETAKVISLESFKLNTSSYGLGYDSTSDDYKVVCLSKPLGKSGSVVDVYSVGMKCWKRTANSPYDFAPSPYDGGFAPGVYLNDCIHWFGRDTSNDFPVLLCYNLACEEFEEGLMFPFSVHGRFGFEVRVLEGCLALVFELDWHNGGVGKKGIDVWVMREYGVRDSWTKFTTIDCLEYNVHMPYNVVCVLNEDEIVVERYSEKFFAYNWRNKVRRDLVIDGLPNEH